VSRAALIATSTIRRISGLTITREDGAWFSRLSSLSSRKREKRSCQVSSARFAIAAAAAASAGRSASATITVQLPPKHGNVCRCSVRRGCALTGKARVLMTDWR
jgi:hypothetical protein